MNRLGEHFCKYGGPAASQSSAAVQSFGVDALLGAPFSYGRAIYFSINGQPVVIGTTTTTQAFVAS